MMHFSVLLLLKDAGGKKEKGGGGNSVNVRHILCEKHSKCLEVRGKEGGGREA